MSIRSSGPVYVNESDVHESSFSGSTKCGTCVTHQVAVGDVVVRSYTPARTGQRTTIIHIYCSERTDPSFVTDPGVRRCGTLCLDLTDALYHHHDTSSSASASDAGGSESESLGGRAASRSHGRREIRTRMTFGDTEIRVDAVDLTTGRCVRAGIDFLNKWPVLGLLRNQQGAWLTRWRHGVNRR